MTSTRSAWVSRRNILLCPFAATTLTLSTSLALAQPPLAQPPVNPNRQALAFEVASIRTEQGPDYSGGDFSSSGPRVRLEGYTLRGLIMESYSFRNFQVSIPTKDGQENILYDIVANAPEGTAPTRDEFRRMLQTLLADRFQLKAHIEKRPMPVYALVVGKAGPKLSPPSQPSHEFHGVSGRNQFLKTNSVTMYDLADYIKGSFATDRPVIDRTGLTGTYKLRVEATPEYRINGDPQPGDLSIFTAVQEQLGLKLEPSTAPLEILVIDSAQKPSEN
jgi:uncharacterized protein (TIGR03435 family)